MIKNSTSVRQLVRMVENGVQRLDANALTQFSKPQLDEVLNIAQSRYVDWVLANKALTDKDKRDYLYPLLTKNFSIPAISPLRGGNADGYMAESYQYLGETAIENHYYGCLPHNFMSVSNVRALTARPATANACDNLGTTRVNNDMELQEYVCVLPFVANTNSICANNIIDFRIIARSAPNVSGVHTDLTIFDYQLFTKSRGFNMPSGIKDEQDKYVIINLVLNYLNRFNAASEYLNFETLGDPLNPNPTPPANEYQQLDTDNSRGDFFHVYWERYKDQYYPNSFVFVSKNRRDVSRNVVLTSGANPYTGTTYITDADYNNTSQLGGIVIELVGSAQSNVQNNASGFTAGRYYQVSYSRQVLSIVDWLDGLNPATILASGTTPRPATEQAYQTSVCSFVGDNLYTNMTGLGSPTYKRPIYTLASSFIHGYSDGNFVIRKFLIDYYRQPVSISQEWGQTTELPNTQFLVDLAVLYILEAVSSPRYQTKLQETFQTKQQAQRQ